MSMLIRTNLMSLRAHRNIKNTESKTQKALERLSSGYKINSAADDAAGLAISEKMRAQIRGLEQAGRNVEDAISLLQTQDGGMDQISSMVIRSRELIIKALNDTNTEEDKDKIQLEIDQLKDEIDACANNTQFNNIPLLNVTGKLPDEVGSGSGGIAIYKAYVSNDSLDIAKNLIQSCTFTNVDSQSMQSYLYSSGGMANAIYFNIERYMLDIKPDIESFIDNELYDAGGNTVDANAQIFADVIAKAIQKGFQDAGLNYTFKGEYGADGRVSVEVTKPANTGFFMGGCTAIPTNGFGHDYMHVSFSPDTSTQIGEEVAIKASADLWIQCGANAGQGTFLNRYDCRTTTLGVSNIVVKPRDAAERSLDDLDNALYTLNSYRAVCGASQNRLEHTDNSLTTAFTNLQDSLSRISDADMAKEMMELTKAQVLSSAGMSMLAQANQQPQTVLQLLNS